LPRGGIAPPAVTWNCQWCDPSAGGGIAAPNDLVMVTRNLSDFADFQGLQLLDWFSEP